MGRPRKEGASRLDVDIRIPLTREQKQLIADATRSDPEGMAAWARSLLVDAAKRRIKREQVSGRTGRS